MPGSRKAQVFRLALAALCGGMLCALAVKHDSADTLFSTFATGLAGLATAFMAGNVGEHFAKRGDDKQT